MKITGLTGGIGTGKSTAASYLKRNGFGHIDADEIHRELTAEGSPLLPLLDDVFGPGGDMGTPGRKILNDDGTLDRKALADAVFTDQSKKERLDRIMFAEIINVIERRIKEFSDAGYRAVILDAPLLFESVLDSKCDDIILITADMDTRIKRVCARYGVSPSDVRNRINSQMSDDEKARGADMIIDNSGTETELYSKLDEAVGILR